MGGKVGYVFIDNNDDWLGLVYVCFYVIELFFFGVEVCINDFYDD